MLKMLTMMPSTTTTNEQPNLLNQFNSSSDRQSTWGLVGAVATAGDINDQISSNNNNNTVMMPQVVSSTDLINSIVAASAIHHHSSPPTPPLATNTYSQTTQSTALDLIQLQNQLTTAFIMQSQHVQHVGLPFGQYSNFNLINVRYLSFGVF